ncbi:MAG: glutathione S-transferase family protein [Albidovulum sp.]
MITLITFPPAFGQPASSPFCVKAMCLLELSGADWQAEEIATPVDMPMQKLPVIRHDGKLIADSNAIRHYLEARGHDFDAGLSPAERAQSLALIRMIEEHFYFSVVLDRWGNDAVWPKIRDIYFGGIPEAVRDQVTTDIRDTLLTGLRTQGEIRFPPEQRLIRAKADLDAVRLLLGDKPYIFGNTPSAADCAIAPMIAGAAATPADTSLATLVRGDKVLMDYCARFASKAYPAMQTEPA